MAEEPKYCEKCRAPWVWGNDFCVQCGYRLPAPSFSPLITHGDESAQRNTLKAHEKTGHHPRHRLRLRRAHTMAVPSPFGQGEHVRVEITPGKLFAGCLRDGESRLSTRS
jgi:hypothetical protein